MKARLMLLLVAVVWSSCSSSCPPTVQGIPAVPRAISESFQVSHGRATARKNEASSRGADPAAASRPAFVDAPAEPVPLDRVLSSVDRHFPGLIAARLEIAAAEARILSAQGAFDTNLAIDAKSKGIGYYEHELLNFSLVQPFENSGATVRSGYRFGLGDFAPYDGDLQTNEGGEVFLGFDVPLLKDNVIDARRAQLWKARIEREATDVAVHEKRVEVTLKATAAYWKCVAAASKVAIARDLLDLARSRQEQLAELVSAGQLPEITLPDNDRLVVERQAILVGTIRSFELAAIGLSLYLRDDEGRPMRVRPEVLPGFPELPAISEQDLESHVAFGLSYRPELIQLSYEIAAAEVERRKFDNDLLPKLDIQLSASQDVGASTTSNDSLDPFEVGVGLKLEVPLARRAASGRLAAARIKIMQLREKSRLAADQVEAEIRNAASALARAREQLALNERSVRLAEIVEKSERDLLLEGESDLLRVNLREQGTAKVRSDEIEARATCFLALAEYRAAMGLPEAEAQARDRAGLPLAAPESRP